MRRVAGRRGLVYGRQWRTTTPAASGIASAGISHIAREASQVTEVRRRRGFRGGPFIGFGSLYYYGQYSYYGGYPYGYYNDYYYRPRYRRSYRRSDRGSRSCRRAHRACVHNWGYGGGNYAGCVRYERCRPR